MQLPLLCAACWVVTGYKYHLTLLGFGRALSMRIKACHFGGVSVSGDGIVVSARAF